MAGNEDADNLAELIPSLPVEKRFLLPFAGSQRRQYRGYWLPESNLLALAAARRGFEAEPTDVFLVSCPKSGTTWLSALAFATVHRGAHPPSHRDHPLRRQSPHACVLSIKTVFRQPDDVARGVLKAYPSPRIFFTHFPLRLRVPDRVHLPGAKDVVVSWWRSLRACVPDDPEGARFDAVFDLFCQGRNGGGPCWRNALEHCRRRPRKVLFLRCEEMLREPQGNLRRLAEFLGCAFSEAEEKAGVVDAILELCGMEKLMEPGVNQSGEKTGEHSSVRKGRRCTEPDLALASPRHSNHVYVRSYRRV
ncbi:hypothetical protein VPH35_011157 [Triticum aestivum]